MNPTIESSMNKQQGNNFSAALEPGVGHQTLNVPVIKQLVYKDWYLNRKLLAIYTGGGIFALSIISLGDWQFYIGSIILITMMVAMGNHQLSTTMIGERKEQTLAFIMSLPVSPADYAMAKLLSNMVLFFVPWSLLIVVITFVLLYTPIPDGLLPFTLLVCGLIAVNHCVCWSVTMFTETEASFLMVMIGLNCLLNPMLYFLARSPDIGGLNGGATVVWSSSAIHLLIYEIILVALLLIGTLYFRSRKKVFF